MEKNKKKRCDQLILQKKVKIYLKLKKIFFVKIKNNTSKKKLLFVLLGLPFAFPIFHVL